MVRRMVPVNAVVFVPGEEVTDLRLKRYLEDHINEETCKAVEVFEKERLRGLMGGWHGTITDFMYSLVGYLTTRKRPLFFGAKYGCASIASLMGEIREANDLPPCSEADQWPKLKVTDDMDGYTNDPSLATNQVAAPPPTPEEALSQLLSVIRSMPLPDQNVALAAFLGELKRRRDDNFRAVTNTRDHYLREQSKAEQQVDELDRIIRGDYFTLVVHPKAADNG
jgi:hypothetical protein